METHNILDPFASVTGDGPNAPVAGDGPNSPIADPPIIITGG